MKEGNLQTGKDEGVWRYKIENIQNSQQKSQFSKK